MKRKGEPVMKRKPRWFKLSPAEFLADRNVERMTIQEFGLYCYLLMRAWLDGGIPASLPEVGRYAMLRGLSRAKLEKLWQGVQSCWVPSPDPSIWSIRDKKSSEKWSGSIGKLNPKLVRPALKSERKLGLEVQQMMQQVMSMC